MAEDLNPAPLVFVYGTLLRGEGNHGLIEHQGTDMEYVGTAWVRGRIFDLGAFPGFGEGAGRVKGEIYRVHSARALASLDGLEGYRADAPERSMYIRREIRTHPWPRKAWIYEWNGRHPGVDIPSGDWHQHMDEKMQRQIERRQERAQFAANLLPVKLRGLVLRSGKPSPDNAVKPPSRDIAPLE